MREIAAKKGKAVEAFLVYIVFLVLVFALTSGTYAIEADIALGKTLYKQECAICHGAEGKGDGSAARFLYPKPRDFTKGVFKIRSTPSLPADEDLFQTISQGIPGTLMPSFEYLSEENRWALVAYIKSFSEKFKETESLEPIEIPDPPSKTPELMALGQQFYEDAGCFNCHGATGKGDGPSAGTLTDDWGNPIVPYDFTIPGKMKGGSSVKDIYRTLTVGIGGTPMPAYGEVLNDEEVWALVYYVQSLAGEAPPTLALGSSVIGKDLFTGASRFRNGGAPCIGCHSIAGIGALGGGAMGPDLTPAQSKFGVDRLTSVLTDFPFPTMNAVFGEKSLAPEEQANLIAFFRSASVTQRPTPAVGKLALLAVGGAVVLLVLMHLLWRRRLTEVRRPLVEQLA